MKRALVLQTEDTTDQELEDLVQYCTQIKGLTCVTPHDILRRRVSGQFVLIYCGKELHLVNYPTLTNTAEGYKIVTAKDKYDFFKLFNNEFKYE